jgi:hypothetical protein
MNIRQRFRQWVIGDVINSEAVAGFVVQVVDIELTKIHEHLSQQVLEQSARITDLERAVKKAGIPIERRL